MDIIFCTSFAIGFLLGILLTMFLLYLHLSQLKNTHTSAYLKCVSHKNQTTQKYNKQQTQLHQSQSVDSPDYLITNFGIGGRSISPFPKPYHSEFLNAHYNPQ